MLDAERVSLMGVAMGLRSMRMAGDGATPLKLR
jgi:hypothetical protein